jgi:glycosyltransferase involved in cell wall biosynthesis
VKRFDQRRNRLTSHRTLRILLVPSNDWMSHPNPMRHHFIFRRLAENHDCEIFVLSFSGLGRSKVILNPGLVSSSRIRLLGRPLFRIINPALYYAINSAQMWITVDRALRELGIDVVVNSNLIPGAITSTLARRRSIPVIFDCMEYYPQSASAYFKNPSIKRLTETVVERFMRFLIHVSDVVITVSDAHAELVRRIDQRKPVYIVPNGVDFELFRPSCTASPKNKPKLTLLYVGSVDDWLDLDTVLSALQQLKRESIGVSFTIVGASFGGAYMERMKSLASSYGLKENVLFAGPIPYVQVPYYINSANVALAPYRKALKNNVTPLKILEYLACQRIVFCTEVPELISRFGNLLFFYEGSKDLTRLLKMAASDAATMEDKVRNARRELAQYSWDRLANEYDRILRTVLIKSRVS